MSFNHDVKRELVTIEGSVSDFKAELYGFLRARGELSYKAQTWGIKLKLPELFLARRVMFLLKRCYSLEPELIKVAARRLENSEYYEIRVAAAEAALRDLELLGPAGPVAAVPEKARPLTSAILRGMFLARGSISSPESKNYHLEILVPDPACAEFIERAGAVWELAFKRLSRQRGELIYLKRSDKIGDFLKAIGASATLFTFENARIKRDLANVVNRMLNCDIANSERTQKVANLQLAAIARLKVTGQFELLSPRLAAAATLREKYPDSSLQELSEASEAVFGRKLSKTGIKHCLDDLLKLAEKKQ